MTATRKQPEGPGKHDLPKKKTAFILAYYTHIIYSNRSTDSHRSTESNSLLK